MLYGFIRLQAKYSLMERWRKEKVRKGKRVVLKSILDDFREQTKALNMCKRGESESSWALGRRLYVLSQRNSKTASNTLLAWLFSLYRMKNKAKLELKGKRGQERKGFILFGWYDLYRAPYKLPEV
uniref:Uncharacterized protein n=1 Tax=Onchocerca volvulus TaxID=6282 RepID=A0A8R1TTJ3_ONCVO